MKAILTYSNHVYEEELDNTDFYCPNCGGINVMVEKGEGDYYLGPDHFCPQCKCIFSLSISFPTDLKFKI
jgi:predicted RNA-binding Zn-ribbon protein involved in translation (DUF1610 family)